jgi:hypothetical protein
MKMKKLLKPLILLIALIAVWAAIHFTSKKPGQPEKDLVFTVNVDTLAITRIEISRAAQQVILLRSVTGWSVQTPGGAKPAEEEGVLSALGTLNEIKSTDLVSHNPEKQAEFRVDSIDGTRVRIYGAGDKVLGDIVIGKIGGFDQQQMAAGGRGMNPNDFYTYMRRADNDRVFKVQGFFGGMLGTDIEQWRNHLLMSFEPALARRIALTFPDEKVSLEADSSGRWSVLAPNAAPADSAVVERMLAALSGLRASGFQDTLSAPAELGFEPPSFAVSVELANGPAFQLEVGREIGNNLFYCRRPGDQQVYTLARYRLDQVMKRQADLLRKQG